MRFVETPPADWDERIAFPLQSVGFAHAARALGHHPLFAEDPRGRALVLVRRLPGPVLRTWTARAKVYADIRNVGFLRALVEGLRALGVSHVKLGDSTWGMSGAALDGWRALRPVVYHVMLNDLSVGGDAMLERVTRTIRRHVRRAMQELTVAEVRTATDLRDYLSLVEQTQVRMRVRDQAAVYPAAYFQAILREMVPRRQALLLVARAGDAPVAGGTFVTTSEQFVHLHGCSTRDRLLTPKQGPTAIFWHAMQLARAAGCAVFNMGAVTPSDDPDHPHYSVYTYKKRWGGRLVEVPCAELVVSPWKYRLQESLLAPMWDRLHPVYLRVFGEAAEDAGPAIRPEHEMNAP
jgi:lipid II:glycine glycyltransferase (peptidoglycan interpeptide bridge formation enzyme)